MIAFADHAIACWEWQESYDMVDKVWRIGNLYQRKGVVDLVHSRNSRFLKIRIKCFDQVNL